VRPRGGARGAGRDSFRREESTNVIDTVHLVCRGVNLNRHGPDANTRLAQATLIQLRSQTGWFETNETKLVGQLGVLDADQMTFSFEMQLRLNRPFEY
jgi:hypothetical protein